MDGNQINYTCIPREVEAAGELGREVLLLIRRRNRLLLDWKKNLCFPCVGSTFFFDFVSTLMRRDGKYSDDLCTVTSKSRAQRAKSYPFSRYLPFPSTFSRGV